MSQRDEQDLKTVLEDINYEGMSVVDREATIRHFLESRGYDETYIIQFLDGLARIEGRKRKTDD